MKRKIWVCAFILIMLAMLLSTVSLQVFAEKYSAPSYKITVTGEAVINIEPNMAMVTIGVESFDKSVIEAEQENKQSVIGLINTLLNNNIEKKDITTKNFNIYKKYTYDKVEKHTGYQVVNTVEFVTDQLENIGKLISNLIQNGANTLGGIRFYVKDTASIKEQALSAALANATKKAEALSSSGSVQIAKIVEENTYHTPFRYEVMASDTKTASNIASGECVISASIKVEYKTL